MSDPNDANTGKLSKNYSSFSVMMWFKLPYTQFPYFFSSDVGLTLPCTSVSWAWHHRSLGRQSKCVCVFRGWRLLVVSHLCPKISKGRSFVLMAEVPVLGLLLVTSVCLLMQSACLLLFAHSSFFCSSNLHPHWWYLAHTTFWILVLCSP